MLKMNQDASNPYARWCWITPHSAVIYRIYNLAREMAGNDGYWILRQVSAEWNCFSMNSISLPRWIAARIIWWLKIDASVVSSWTKWKVEYRLHPNSPPFLFLSRFLHLSTLWNFSWMDLQSLETQQETLKYFSPWISCLQPAFQWLKTEYRYNGFFYHDLQSAVDVSYTVDNSAIHLPFHISDDKKFVWNFTTSAVICPTLGKVCSPSVWASEGEFRYTNGGFEFVQCQFIIRRWALSAPSVELFRQRVKKWVVVVVVVVVVGGGRVVVVVVSGLVARWRGPTAARHR